MRRPLVLMCITLILGIVVARSSESIIFLVAGALFLICVYLSLRNIMKLKVWVVISCLTFYLIGGVLCIGEINLNSKRMKQFCDKDVLLLGQISEAPDIRVGKVMYTVKPYTISIDNKTFQVKGKILVTIQLQEGQQPVDYGSLVEIEGFLKKPSLARNPGAFDYRKYLYQKDVWGQIYLTDGQIKKLNKKVENPAVRLGLTLRKRVVSTIEASVPGQQGALLNGMLIGYTFKLGDEVEEAFRKAGLSHIMAVSGANIAFIVLPLIFLFKKAGFNKKNANILISLIVLLFVFTTGFEPSVTRAAIMALTMLSGGILMRETDVYASLAFAATLMLLLNPFTLYNIGFQLSFGATVSLVVFYPVIKKTKFVCILPSWIGETLAATLAAQVGVLPISLISFNTISVISVISNILVVPLTGLVTIVGLVGALIGQVWMLPACLLGYINYTVLTYILWIVKISAEVPFSTITTSTPAIITIILYYFAAWFFLNFKPVRKFRLPGIVYGLTGFMIIIALFISNIAPKPLEAIILDVGEGDSIFVHSATGRTVLVDGGGSITSEKGGRDIGAQVVAPFLLDMGVRNVDIIVATHGHADHIQGLEYVLRNFWVGCLVAPDGQSTKKEFSKVMAICKSKGIKVVECKKGHVINVDSKTVMKVLSPFTSIQSEITDKNLYPEPQNNQINNNKSLNNTSLVLKLEYGDFSLLLTGDIEKEIEEKILGDGCNLESDIIKIGHHGSKTSSSESFLDKVKAKAAIISVGTNNFGHPSRQTIEKLQNKLIQTFRTDYRGAITIRTDGKKIQILPMINEE